MALSFKHLIQHQPLSNTWLKCSPHLFSRGRSNVLAPTTSPIGKYTTRGCSLARPKEGELFPQRFILPENHGYTPTLSPPQVNSLIKTDETSRVVKVPGRSVIKGFDSNQLGSNYPIEDRRSQARLQQSEGLLFGVFDGHGGCACAQAVSERLFDYIAVSLLNPQQMEDFSHSLKTDSGMELLHWHRNLNEYHTEHMASLYRNSLQKYVIESLSMFDCDTDSDSLVASALKSAFLRLDNDISVEALPLSGTLDYDCLEVALSGACATVALIQHLDVHVASVGDTRAVIGQITDSGKWNAVPLSRDHNTNSEEELARVKSEHPIAEASSVIKNNRLLSQLIPLRAFGDMRYKWSITDLKNLVKILDSTYAQTIQPMNYYTPPYLSCTPDVTTHRLTSQDKFLVLGTDGLWENLSNEQVVKLVGEHMLGEDTVDHYVPENVEMTIGAINRELAKRKSMLALKSSDDNVSTHLIRHTLGPEHKKLSDMLTMPPEVVRYYRDDITITVVFFDSHYIAKHT